MGVPTSLWSRIFKIIPWNNDNRSYVTLAEPQAMILPSNGYDGLLEALWQPLHRLSLLFFPFPLFIALSQSRIGRRSEGFVGPPSVLAIRLWPPSASSSPPSLNPPSPLSLFLLSSFLLFYVNSLQSGTDPYWLVPPTDRHWIPAPIMWTLSKTITIK